MVRHFCMTISALHYRTTIVRANIVVEEASARSAYIDLRVALMVTCRILQNDHLLSNFEVWIQFLKV